MNYFHRKLMLMGAIGAFLMISPLVALYAMGYRLSLNNDTPQAVGVLLVETIPRRADLEVNGRFIGRTPRSVPNLPPGSVDVKLSKEGYTDWRKRLSISPTMATDLRGVRLFPTQPVSRLIDSNIDSFSLSPNRKLLSVIERGSFVKVLDSEGEQVMPSVPLQANPVKTLWSSDNTLLAFRYEDGSLSVLDISRPEIGSNSIAGITGAEVMSWDTRTPGRLLILSSDHNLLAYNTVDGTFSQIASNILSFALSSRRIITAGENNKLNIHSLDGRIIRTLPIELDTRVQSLLVTPGGKIGIQFKNGQLALLKNEDELDIISESALSADWSADGQMLYIQPTHNELFVYNVSNERLVYFPRNKMTLVTRLSRSISNPQWFAGGYHLIYEVGGEISIIEIDTRDRAVNYKMVKSETDRALAAVGEEGDVVYHLQKMENGQTALMETSLIVEN